MNPINPKTGVALSGSGTGTTLVTGSADLDHGGVFHPHDGVTWSLTSLTIQNTLTSNYATCIALTSDGGSLTINDISLLCGTDGIYAESSGTNDFTITGANITATGSWDWYHADDNLGGGAAHATLSNVTATIDGGSGYQQPAESTGIGMGGACTLTINNGTLSAANGPSVTITTAVAGGGTLTLNNVTLTANGSVGAILVADAIDAGTVINLHTCTFDHAKTATAGGAVINIT